MGCIKVKKNSRHLAWLGLAALLVLPACLSVKVDESTAFAPPKRELGPATTISDLNARMTERFERGEAQGIWRLSPEARDGLKVTFRSDSNASPAGKTLPAPMILRNGFIGEGAGRVAWTLYTSVAADGAERGPDRPLVVHCAGNAGDRYNSGGKYAQKALPWADVLVFDYPGYGDTPGPASAANFESVGSALSGHIVTLSQNRKLVFWGHSLGGFVCARLAATIPTTDGLVLETTAPTAAAVAQAWTPSYARLFVRTSVVPSLASYDVVADAAKVKGPVLVLGAAKDQVLPVALARQVAEDLRVRIPNVTYIEFQNARHENVPDQPNFNQTINAFFLSVESQK